MASSKSDLGSYEPVLYHHDDEGRHIPDVKHLANFRQNSKFSEQFTIEGKSMSENVRIRDMNGWDRFMERANNWWLWELSAVVLSLGFLAVVIWHLIYLDGTPLEAWKFPISPNAFLSTFVVLCKSTMLVAIGSGIAQMRWLYYESAARNLDELDMFDEASRGPWGAAIFLFFERFNKGSARTIATVGALIMVLALSMDPFAQQIFSFEYRQIERTNDPNRAMVRRTTGHHGGVSVLNNNDARKAIYGGLLNFEVPEPLVCSTNNCSFPSFASLGVYSDCQDVAQTSRLSCEANAGTINENCTRLVYTIPSVNLSLTLQNGSVATTTPDDRVYTLIKSVVSPTRPNGTRDTTQFTFATAQLLVDLNSDSAISDRSQVAQPQWNITACKIKWCAKVYNNLWSRNGTMDPAQPDIVDLVPVVDHSCFASGECQAFTVADPSRVPAADAPTVYTMDSGADGVKIRNVLEFDHNVTIRADSDTFSTSDAYNIAASLFWNTNMTSAMAHIMTTYTNFLRSNSDSSPILGSAYTRETYVEVTWAWFALPAFLVLTSAVFLIAVIVVSKRRGGGNQPMWKTSTLPLLLHGLEGWDRDGYSGTESRVAIDIKARDMRARLHRNMREELVFIKA